MATEAGGDDVVQVVAVEVGMVEAVVEALLGHLLQLEAGVHHMARDDLIVLVQQHGLGVGAAQVDACGEGHDEASPAWCCGVRLAWMWSMANSAAPRAPA